MSTVMNLEEAYQAYWSAKNRREEQSAYHEILLFGGRDGYPDHGAWKSAVIRLLRRLANWLDK